MNLSELVAGCFEPIPNQTVTEWCLANLIIPPPQSENPGPFSLTGREYFREVIDDFGDTTIKDAVECFGSQSGKTTALMAGLAWCVVNDPSGILWVMPNSDLARSFSETRWSPICHATPLIERLIPKGQRRHDFKKAQQQLGGALINFIGSNSPANLASRPVRRLILDEVDKFDEGGRGEADAVNLAEQRTKTFGNPQRRKTSTPTVAEGLIWQEFLKGDQRRYFVPCPHCGKFIVFAWSKGFSVFKQTGAEAFVEWDKEAKRDGEWNLERVLKSARAVCPHCAGHILDSQKTKMLRAGKWRATATAPVAFRSRHLPSLYCASPQTSFCALAVKFLQAKKSLMGLQGFINGDLAEPYMSQDTRGERIEVIASKAVEPKSNKMLTVDVQGAAPYFWFCVRSWSATETHGIEAGSLMQWEDIEVIQQKHGIPNEQVVIDSGFNASDVYAECIKHSEQRWCRGRNGAPQLTAMGWMPAKGQPAGANQEGARKQVWENKADPSAGKGPSGGIIIPLLEFHADFLEDILDGMRRGRGSVKWSIAPEVATDEYWRQMDAKHKVATINRRTGKARYEWIKRSQHWPEHLRDCEIMQIAGACHFGWFDLEQ